MKKLIIILATVVAMPILAHAQLGNAAHCVPTNFTADATNKVFTVPMQYNWITIQNDSGTNIYFTPDMTFTNYFTTNSVGSGTGIYLTNTTVIVTNAQPVVAAVGKGTRLNASGGTAFYDCNGKPVTTKFQFISQGGNGNNVCIEIGTVK